MNQDEGGQISVYQLQKVLELLRVQVVELEKERDSWKTEAIWHSQKVRELEETLGDVEAFDDQVFSTNDYYRIGWQDAIRSIRRVVKGTQ